MSEQILRLADHFAPMCARCGRKVAGVELSRDMLALAAPTRYQIVLECHGEREVRNFDVPLVRIVEGEDQVMRELVTVLRTPAFARSNPLDCSSPHGGHVFSLEASYGREGYRMREYGQCRFCGVTPEAVVERLPQASGIGRERYSQPPLRPTNARQPVSQEDEVLLKEYPSKSSPGKKHEVRIGADNRIYCTCPSWKFKKGRGDGMCKHVKAYRKEMKNGDTVAPPATASRKSENTILEWD